MVKIENECVGCPAEMGCLDERCPYFSVVHFYCDKCKDESDKLYRVDDEQICEDCLLSMFPIVDEDDYT